MNLQERQQKLIKDDISAVLFPKTESAVYCMKRKGELNEVVRISRDHVHDTSAGFIGEGIHQPKFSPNGQKIAFLRKNQIWVFDLSTSKETKLTESGTAKQRIIWTNDSNNIIYSSGKELIKIAI